MLDGTNGPTAVIGRAALQIDLSIGGSRLCATPPELRGSDYLEQPAPMITVSDSEASDQSSVFKHARAVLA
jgi:hypothetical protein